MVVLTVTWTFVNRQLSYGTFSADKTPPKIIRCGRDWLRGSADGPPQGGLPGGLHRVGTTPGGAPIVSEVPGCGGPAPTGIWVDLGGGHYFAYGLSGGP